jgi:glycosyltransferase involved in cell wall biosynthesis
VLRRFRHPSPPNVRGTVAPVRILRVITRLNIGGPSIHALELSHRLAARGHETLLVHGALDAGEGDMRYHAAPSVSLRCVAALRRPLAPADDVRALAQLISIVREFQPQIVHTHMAKAGAIGRTAARLCNIGQHGEARSRTVHTYHGHVLEGYFSPAKARLFVAIERQLARTTDRLIAISPRIEHELADDYRIGIPAQYRVVPLGFDLSALLAIDDEMRRDARARLDIPPEAHVVSTVGRLTAIKDHELFLDVAARVVSSDAAARFLIVGDGDRRSALETGAATRGIGDRVAFLGWRRDLAAIYGATDVFLLTSRNEGTPVALIESLAAGVPGVSTDVGGVADVIDADTLGLLAPTGAADALAHHVLTLLRDPDRRRRIGTAGRARVSARYTIERLVDDIDRLYRELLI